MNQTNTSNSNKWEHKQEENKEPNQNNKQQQKHYGIIYQKAHEKLNKHK